MDMAQRSELGRALQTFSVNRARGERALLIAIIGYAARDALDGDAGAAAWLLSDGYRFYLDLLELPPEWLPAGLDRGGLAGLVERAAGRVQSAASRGRPSPALVGARRGRAGHIMPQIATD